VNGCGYSPDGAFIVSVSEDGTLKVWDARTGQYFAALIVEWPLHNCSWSPHGQQLVAVGPAGVYFLRFVRLGQESLFL
jgi:WD40 repeat protein